MAYMDYTPEFAGYRILSPFPEYIWNSLTEEQRKELTDEMFLLMKKAIEKSSKNLDYEPKDFC